jgi:threonine/homoserine/homoserine lactone efflux protein
LLLFLCWPLCRDPVVYAVISKSVSSGLKGAICTIFGIITGDVIFLLFAIFGLKHIAEYLGFFFVFVKYAGALYLCCLGLKNILIKERKSVTPVSGTDFLSGLSITLGNPKVILFYLSFMPTFLDFKLLTGVHIFVVVLIVIFALFIVLFSYAYMAYFARKSFYDIASIGFFDKIAGAVMILAAASIIAKEN